MRTRAQVEADVPTKWHIESIMVMLQLILEVLLDIREQEATLKTTVV